MEAFMESLSPVVLSGGSGTRLWPLSRVSQAAFALYREDSLFQATVRRMEGPLPTCEVGSPVIVCNEEYRFVTFGTATLME